MSIRAVISAVLAIACAVMIHRYCFVPYRCNLRKHVLVLDSQRSQNAVDFNLAKRLAVRNVALAESLLRDCPTDIDLLMLHGANLRTLGRFTAAAASYSAAIAIEERPELYFELAETDLAMGDKAAAVTNYSNAVRFHPQIIADINDQRVRADVESRVFKR